MDMSGPLGLLSGHVRPAGAAGRGLGAIARTSEIRPCPSVDRMDVRWSVWTCWSFVDRWEGGAAERPAIRRARRLRQHATEATKATRKLLVAGVVLPQHAVVVGMVIRQQVAETLTWLPPVR